MYYPSYPKVVKFTSFPYITSSTNNQLLASHNYSLICRTAKIKIFKYLHPKDLSNFNSTSKGSTVELGNKELFGHPKIVP